MPKPKKKKTQKKNTVEKAFEKYKSKSPYENNTPWG